MLIPMRQGRLLVPSATVAEVIGYRTPDPVAESPLWLQGTVSWRQRDIPVIDFERLMGRSHVGAGIRQRIVVCYAIGRDAASPLFGVVAQGIPRLLHLQNDLIGFATAREPGEKAVRMTLAVSDESLMVPDLEFVQQKLADRMVTA
ncbi:MAG: chemotaxis protein CheW [Chromatiaceae bacterium]|nr:chemotaxis protein CheW [Gammaproteobacteria bacterium]MCP5300055.1 chemotaxis protein CheW [Chromatiaceae bacterium]MCP5422127.1 chemotaxis protein CheW [Chromatiaceae bacterium]